MTHYEGHIYTHIDGRLATVITDGQHTVAYTQEECRHCSSLTRAAAWLIAQGYYLVPDYWLTNNNE